MFKMLAERRGLGCLSGIAEFDNFFLRQVAFKNLLQICDTTTYSIRGTGASLAFRAGGEMFAHFQEIRRFEGAIAEFFNLSVVQVLRRHRIKSH